MHYSSFLLSKSNNIPKQSSQSLSKRTFQIDLRKNSNKKYLMTDSGTKNNSLFRIQNIITQSNKSSPNTTIGRKSQNHIKFHRYAFSECRMTKSELPVENNRRNNSAKTFNSYLFNESNSKPKPEIKNKNLKIAKHYHCSTLSSSIKSSLASVKTKYDPKKQNGQPKNESSKIISIMQIAEKIITNTSASKSNGYLSTDIKPNNKNKNFSVISLHIISNWGHKAKVGITEIQLYDAKKRKIQIADCHVFNGNEDEIGRIHNNKYHSLNDCDMWTTPMTKGIKIEMYILPNITNNNIDVASVVIWNYNAKDVNKGIKEIEIWKKNAMCWHGIVPKGSYNKKVNYSFRIKLTSGIEDKVVKVVSNRNNQKNRNILFFSLCNFTNENKFRESASSRSKLLELNSNEPKIIRFNKISIFLLDNHGNSEHIGLTGISFIDADNSVIDIERADCIGAMPKDLRTTMNLENDYRIFENVFNGVNNTVDENDMWLTIKGNKASYIELYFREIISMKHIDIWNYNSPFSLDKGVKKIRVVFDDDRSNKSYDFLIRKGVGCVNANDDQKGDTLKQRISFLSKSKIKTNAITYSKRISSYTNRSIKHGYNPSSLLLPCGFVVKVVAVSNWGNTQYISIKSFDIFDIENKNYRDCTTVTDINLINSRNSTNEKYIYYDDFFDYKRDVFSLTGNYFAFICNEFISVAYIVIENSGDLTGVRGLLIYIDDKIIFDGEIRKEGKSYILFADDDILVTKAKIDKNKIINDSILQKKNSYTETILDNGTCILTMNP